MTRFRKVLLASGVALAALGAAACSRDAGTAPPAPALREGSRLSGLVHDAHQAVGMPAAAPLTRPFSSTVSGGLATLDSGGVVAIAGGPRGSARGRSYTDEEGRRHDVLLEAAPGGPVRRVRHHLDGRPLVEASFEWEPRQGGWVLRQRTIAVYHGGRVVAQMRRSVELQEPLAGAGLRPPLPSAASLGALLLPAPLEAQSLKCLDRWAKYALVSGVLVLAVEAFVAAPSAITYTGLVAAIAAWDAALDAVLACEIALLEAE